MRNLTVILLAILGVFTACSGGDDTPAGNEPLSYEGEVIITSPQDGTIVYAETLVVRGTMYGAETVTMQVQLVNTSDEVIAQTSVTTQIGEWQVTLPHGYVGEPSEIVIRVVPPGIDGVYDTAAVLISDMSRRPAGAFGTITAPFDGSSVGGDMLPVAGTASGLFENTLIVRLVDASGNAVAEQIVTLDNPNFVDVVPWQTELPPGAFTGPGQIRIIHQDAADGAEHILDSVNVTVETAAG